LDDRHHGECHTSPVRGFPARAVAINVFSQ
jgi:hypothetical protein